MLRCVVIDDEPLALVVLQEYIRQVPFLELVIATTDPVAGLQLVQDTDIDLVFLDIQMPSLTGLQFMKIADGKAGFILTTAYSEYALDGYEHNVIDYLLKPIEFDRFYVATEKAKARLDKAPMPAPDPDYIFVRTDGKMVKVNLDDILYIQGLKDYISIQTTRERLIILQSLRYMEEALPARQFLRVHKSFIIALDKIDSYEKNRITIGDEIIPVGESYQQLFSDSIRHKKL